jgi:hypothetical protein
MKKWLLLSLISLMLPYCIGQAVVINEVCSSNNTVISDFEGDSPDWIEIYNAGGSSINLGDYFLSDNDDELYKWGFPNPTTLVPGAYLIVFASGKDTAFSEYHTNFKIKQSGEAIFLTNSAGVLIDSHEGLCIRTDYSYGREIDGGMSLGFLNNTSPGASNNGIGIYTILADTLQWSHLAGNYSSPINLDIQSNNSYDIKFTFDGEAPKSSDFNWSGAQPITGQESKQKLWQIPTSDTWEEPVSDPFQGTVVSAQSFFHECPVSTEERRSFFIDPLFNTRYQVPCISISTDEDGFFADEGIYVPGPNGNNYFKSGEDWEREAYFEYFDESGEQLISLPIDIRINGSGSRQNPHKSLRLYFNKTKLKSSRAPNLFFSNRSDTADYYRLILKAPQSDFTNSMMRNLFVGELIKDFSVDEPASKVVVVFLNGEYWGVHVLEERIDKYQISDQYGVGKDSINFIKHQGSSFFSEEDITDYQDLVNFMSQNDLSEGPVYQTVTEKIDIPSVIDYHLINLFFSNWDWPFKNVEIWNSKRQNSRFKYIFSDCDACLIFPQFDEFQHYNKANFVDDDHLILHHLLKNEQFKSRFTARAYQLLDSRFSPKNTMPVLDSLIDVMAPLMLEHIARWHYPKSLDAWYSDIDDIKLFLLERSSEFLKTLQTNLGPPFLAYPVPTSNELNIPATFDHQDLHYAIYDITGRSIRRKTKINQLQIDLSSLRSGTYLIQFCLKQICWTQKINKY